ncbi:MAG: lectin-like domain-containing protein, partial [Culicoidibacterales bacterium]
MTKKLLKSLISMSMCVITLQGIPLTAIKAEEEEVKPKLVSTTQFMADPPTSRINVQDYFSLTPGSNSYVDSLAKNVLVVTDNLTMQKGGMWANKKIDLSKKANYESSLYIGRSKSKPMGAHDRQTSGDGMTLTFHNDPRGLQAIGGAGGGLGIYSRPDVSTDVFVKNALTFEMDTFVNNSGTNPQQFDKDIEWQKFLGTPNKGRHVGFVYPDNPMGKDAHHQLKSFEEMGIKTDLWQKFTFMWSPNEDGSGELSVTSSNNTIVHKIEDYKAAFGGSEVYWGFTGSTGSATALQALAITKLPQAPIPDIVMKVYNSAGQDVSNGTALEGEKLRYSVTVKETVGEYRLSMASLTDMLPKEVKYLGNAKVTGKDGVAQDLTASKITGQEVGFEINQTVVGLEKLIIEFDVEVNGNTVGSIVKNKSGAIINQAGYFSNEVKVAIINSRTVIDTEQRDAIRAKDFQLNLHEISSLTQDRLEDMADVFAWDLADGQLLSFLTDMSSIEERVGIYPITFMTNLGTTITVNMEVTNGGIPILELDPAIVYVKKDEKVDLQEGLRTFDEEDDNLVAVPNKELDTSETGVKIITYVLTDTDGNVDEADRTYIIESDIDKATRVGDYAIFTRDFTKRVGEVIVSDAELIKEGNARGFWLDDARVVGVDVVNSGGYEAKVGKYTIKYVIRDDSNPWVPGEQRPEATAIGTVISGDSPVIDFTQENIIVQKDEKIDVHEGVSSTDTEDGNILAEANQELDTTETGVQIITYTSTDTDGNVTTADRTYVIESETEKATIGTKYVIFTSNFIRRVGEVNTSNPAVITAANARGFLLADGSTTAVEVTNLGGYKAVVGNYTLA